jgi:hypothetical protein
LIAGILIAGILIAGRMITAIPIKKDRY